MANLWLWEDPSIPRVFIRHIRKPYNDILVLIGMTLGFWLSLNIGIASCSTATLNRRCVSLHLDCMCDLPTFLRISTRLSVSLHSITSKRCYHTSIGSSITDSLTYHLSIGLSAHFKDWLLYGFFTELDPQTFDWLQVWKVQDLQRSTIWLEDYSAEREWQFIKIEREDREVVQERVLLPRWRKEISFLRVKQF